MPTILAMRRRLDLLVVSAMVLAVASCSAPDDQTIAASLGATATTAPTVATTSAATAATAPTVATTSTTAATANADTPGARANALCSSDMTLVLGKIANPTLDETSGLAASRQHRGVIWAHNDGKRAGLFAVGNDGGDLGFHPITLDGVVDIEDMAIISGPDGDHVLLGDIGDNGVRRPSIRIYRFAEPDPSVVAPLSDVDVLEYTYPDGPHNAEVLLVDEINRRVVIVTKEQLRVDGLSSDLGPTAPSFVFEGPLDVSGDEPVRLGFVGMLDAPLLETRTVSTSPNLISLLGIGGLPTGGDVAPDGTLIVLRTYETLWVWPRLAGSSVAESLAADPCQVHVPPEGQGEAVSFMDGSLITASEGVNPNLFEVRP